MYFYILVALATLVFWYIRSSNKVLPGAQLKERLTDRVVIVTGSARGLGKSVAKEFAQHGAKIILIDVIEATLRETEKEFAELLGDNNVHTIVGDLSNKEFCKTVIEDTVSKYGKLDVLYINHGIMPANPIEQLSIETIEKVMAVNFMSFVYLVKHALPHLRASKGMYGVTSSMGGKVALTNLAPYVSSKHALCGFFDVLRIEEKKHGVSVTVVCPGAMKTDMARGDASKSPIKLHLPEDLAPGIVNAVVSRRREHFTDVALRLGGTVRALFPQLVDNILGPLSAQLADK